MPDISYKLTTKGNFFKGKSQAIINKATKRFMTEFALFMVGEVKKRTPQGVAGNKGGLASTIAQKVEVATSFVTATVFHQSVYGDVIEFGRGPNKPMPPKGSLIDWLVIKAGFDIDEAEDIEFVIRRAIGQRGWVGYFMFQKAFFENLPLIAVKASQAGFQITKEINK